MSRELTPPPPLSWQPLLELALLEDIGPGDLTSEITIAPDARGGGLIEAREPLVVCGCFGAGGVLRHVADTPHVGSRCRDGDSLAPTARLMRIPGPLRAILAAERTALNFLTRLSGVATATRRCVEAAAGSRATIVDTRKTLPGWRALDKFAVRAGGGFNHRFALYDGILLKDNHIAAAGGVTAALRRARAAAPAGLRIQVEVESEEQAREAIDAGADFLLIDNRTPGEVQELVASLGGHALLEASGGIHLGNVSQYAATGVDRIAIGAITHSAPAVDIALELEGSNEADRGD